MGIKILQGSVYKCDSSDLFICLFALDSFIHRNRNYVPVPSGVI